MNTIDIVSLVLIAILMLLGLWRGLMKGLFRLLAWIAAIVGAYLSNRFFADSIAGFGFSEFSASIICICVGFLIPFLAFLFAGHTINKAMSGTVVGRVDRILGAIFGLVTAVLVLFAIMTIFHVMPFGGIIQETRDNSITYSAYKSTLEALGYSSKPIDLVGAAERKASEFTENLVNKASDKASEVAKETVDKATEAATKAAKDAADKAINGVSEKATEKAADIKKAAENKVDEAKQALEDKTSEVKQPAKN